MLKIFGTKQYERLYRDIKLQAKKDMAKAQAFHFKLERAILFLFFQPHFV